jgi:hypothetical protein
LPLRHGELLVNWPTPQELAHYTCYRTAGPLAIDGKLDELSWKLAPRSTPFVDIVTGQPAWFDTRVALLWDDEYLYFGFSAEETDVRATLVERDSKIYLDNDLEVFIAGENAYYEFEINAFNTIYEVFWIWKDIFPTDPRYAHRPEFNPATHPTLDIDGIGGHVHPRGRRWGFLDWDFPGLRHAVHIDGVLNRCNGSDKGWSAELAFPWKGLELLADGRALPPRDGDVWRIDCSRFQSVDRSGRPLDPSPGWIWNRHGHYDSHIPETFTYVHFSNQVVGAQTSKP